ncbi:MAG: hypothetical protein J7647_20140 [Cyanobacteria bacterium SBLK]|nr:hypothetical protein [Cyanobacteria bacterium SBLK]
MKNFRIIYRSYAKTIERLCCAIALFFYLQCWLCGTVLADNINTAIETIPLQHRLEIVRDLETREILAPTIARQQQNYYQTQPDRSAAKLLQRVRGVFTLSHVIWIFSSILLVVSLGWLAQLYLLPLLRAIPATAYEIAVYLGCMGTMVGSYYLHSSLREYIALPGCLGFIGALGFSYYLHPKFAKKLCEKLKTDPYSLGCLLIFLIWSAIAILHQSTVLGFISAIALEAYLGFAIVVIPGVYSFGFTQRSLLPRTTLSSLAFLIFYVTIRLGRLQLSYFAIFAPGVLFVGTFVYFLGLLIWSSKWYSDRKREYAILQPVTIASGAIALYLGAVGQIPQLQGIGGTFFFMYIIEKYFELPWHKQTVAWATLGLAILLFASAWVMGQYPQYFLFV